MIRFIDLRNRMYEDDKYELHSSNCHKHFKWCFSLFLRVFLMISTVSTASLISHQWLVILHIISIVNTYVFTKIFNTCHETFLHLQEFKWWHYLSKFLGISTTRVWWSRYCVYSVQGVKIHFMYHYKIVSDGSIERYLLCPCLTR